MNVGGKNVTVMASIRSNSMMMMAANYTPVYDSIVNPFRYREDHFKSLGHYYVTDKVCLPMTPPGKINSGKFNQPN